MKLIMAMVVLFAVVMASEAGDSGIRKKVPFNPPPPAVKFPVTKMVNVVKEQDARSKNILCVVCNVYNSDFNNVSEVKKVYLSLKYPEYIGEIIEQLKAFMSSQNLNARYTTVLSPFDEHGMKKRSEDVILENGTSINSLISQWEATNAKNREAKVAEPKKATPKSVTITAY